MAKNSAGQEIPEIPQCSCGKQNSAGECEHVRPSGWSRVAAPAPAPRPFDNTTPPPPEMETRRMPAPSDVCECGEKDADVCRANPEIAPSYCRVKADRRAPAATAPAGGAAEWPECEEFYNLCQAYRHTPIEQPSDVVAAYEALKRWIRKEANRD